MKKIFECIIFVVLCIWQLPQFIVSLVMLLFVGRVKKVEYRHYNFAFMGEKMLGAISLGPFSILSKANACSKESIAHELDGHTVDSKIFGPLYLFVIGIPSLLNATFHFTKCYYDFYTERIANKHAGLTTNNYCRLIFKDKKEVQ